MYRAFTSTEQRTALYTSLSVISLLLIYLTVCLVKTCNVETAVARARSSCCIVGIQWDAEINFLFYRQPRAIKGVLFKSGVGHNIAGHVFITAIQFAFLTSAFPHGP